MKRIGVLFLSVVSAGFLFLQAPAHACCDDKAAGAAAAEDAAGSVTTGAVCTLKVEGMTCGSCAGSVANAAKSVPGVSGADVDVKAGTAVVRYRPQLADPEAIAGAITKAGYRASVDAQ
ncbi:MAG: heavy-metal-associated domain-containing protein [Deltaproteobacteria bacterium]|nr:heavy-metal-associated domain-containing protein [Deltaproteobacteria bacterium]